MLVSFCMWLSSGHLDSPLAILMTCCDVSASFLYGRTQNWAKSQHSLTSAVQIGWNTPLACWLCCHYYGLWFVWSSLLPSYTPITHWVLPSLPVELLFGQSAPGLCWCSPLQMQFLAFHLLNLMKFWFARSPYCPYPSSSPGLWYIGCFLQHTVVRKDASCHLGRYWRHLAAPFPGIPWGTPRVTAHQLGFAHCWQLCELSSPASFPPTLSSFSPASISPVSDKENCTGLCQHLIESEV